MKAKIEMQAQLEDVLKSKIEALEAEQSKTTDPGGGEQELALCQIKLFRASLVAERIKNVRSIEPPEEDADFENAKAAEAEAALELQHVLVEEARAEVVRCSAKHEMTEAVISSSEALRAALGPAIADELSEMAGDLVPHVESTVDVDKIEAIDEALRDIAEKKQVLTAKRHRAAKKQIMSRVHVLGKLQKMHNIMNVDGSLPEAPQAAAQPDTSPEKEPEKVAADSDQGSPKKVNARPGKIDTTRESISPASPVTSPQSPKRGKKSLTVHLEKIEKQSEPNSPSEVKSIHSEVDSPRKIKSTPSEPSSPAKKKSTPTCEFEETEMPSSPSKIKSPPSEPNSPEVQENNSPICDLDQAEEQAVPDSPRNDEVEVEPTPVDSIPSEKTSSDSVSETDDDDVDDTPADQRPSSGREVVASPPVIHAVSQPRQRRRSSVFREMEKSKKELAAQLQDMEDFEDDVGSPSSPGLFDFLQGFGPSKADIFNAWREIVHAKWKRAPCDLHRKDPVEWYKDRDVPGDRVQLPAVHRELILTAPVRPSVANAVPIRMQPCQGDLHVPGARVLTCAERDDAHAHEQELEEQRATAHPPAPAAKRDLMPVTPLSPLSPRSSAAMDPAPPARVYNPMPPMVPAPPAGKRPVRQPNPDGAVFPLRLARSTAIPVGALLDVIGKPNIYRSLPRQPEEFEARPSPRQQVPRHPEDPEDYARVLRYVYETTNFLPSAQAARAHAITALPALVTRDGQVGTSSTPRPAARTSMPRFAVDAVWDACARQVAHDRAMNELA